MKRSFLSISLSRLRISLKQNKESCLILFLKFAFINFYLLSIRPAPITSYDNFNDLFFRFKVLNNIKNEIIYSFLINF
jgi:hypothetical protein